MSVTRIEKTSGNGPRMSRCVVKGDMVYVAGLTASDRSADIKGQTRQILDKIDDYLSQAGTDKSKLLQANLWICLLYTSPSPRDRYISRMPSSA